MSQTPWEQLHIAKAFRFELSKVTVPAIRRRMVASLRNVDEALATFIATGLGLDLPEALSPLIAKPPAPEVQSSPALSLTAIPGAVGVRTRQVALLVADGVDGDSLALMCDAVKGAGAVPKLVATRLGTFRTSRGDAIEADATMENTPAVLFDALVLPDGGDAVAALSADARTSEFVINQYRHCKTILALGVSSALLDAAGVADTLPDGESDPGVILASDGARGVVDAFLSALALHRHWARESDPPRV